MSQLSKNVLRLKRAHKLSNGQLADLFLTSRRTVQRLVGSAKKNPHYQGYEPSEDTVIKVASFFGVDTEQAQTKLASDQVQASVKMLIIPVAAHGEQHARGYR